MNSFRNACFVGDVLAVRKGPIAHLGIVVPWGILHNHPSTGERLVSWEDFANGQKPEIIRTGAESRAVAERARKILAKPRAYDPLSRNCEHTVNEVLSGQVRSPGISIAVCIAAAIALIVAVILNRPR